MHSVSVHRRRGKALYALSVPNSIQPWVMHDMSMSSASQPQPAPAPPPIQSLKEPKNILFLVHFINFFHLHFDSLRTQTDVTYQPEIYEQDLMHDGVHRIPPKPQSFHRTHPLIACSKWQISMASFIRFFPLNFPILWCLHIMLSSSTFYYYYHYFHHFVSAFLYMYHAFHHILVNLSIIFEKTVPIFSRRFTGLLL